MNPSETRKLIHDLNNSLNVARINTFLLRQIHGNNLDKEAADNLETSIQEAEQLVIKLASQVGLEKSNRSNKKR